MIRPLVRWLYHRLELDREERARLALMEEVVQGAVAKHLHRAEVAELRVAEALRHLNGHFASSVLRPIDQDHLLRVHSWLVSSEEELETLP